MAECCTKSARAWFEACRAAEDREERTALALVAQGEATRSAEARVEAAERAIAAAFRELQRISDVRVNRTKVIGKAALILADALAGREPQQQHASGEQVRAQLRRDGFNVAGREEQE